MTAPADLTRIDANRSCIVRVPGSTSNLGAGFDCIGMAIGRSLRSTVSLAGTGVTIARRGTLADLGAAASDDLLWRGFVAACVAARVALPAGIHFDVDSDIPVGRGLGSSAAAVVAGALAANELLGGGLDPAALHDVAVGLEGHPDNVAPSLLGGTVLSVATGGHRFHSAALHVHGTLRFVFAVPAFVVHTRDARAVLPESVPFATTVSAIAKSAALVAGLASGDRTLLATALDDVVHVPSRRGLVRGFDDVVLAAHAAGAVGATLSGSGPTIVAIALDGMAADRVASAMRDAWSRAGVSAEAFHTTPEPGGATCSRGIISNSGGI